MSEATPLVGSGAALVKVEQAKLSATYFNNLAVALAGVGGLAPLLTSLYSVEGPTTLLLIVSIGCFVASGILHLVARRVLRGMIP